MGIKIRSPTFPASRRPIKRNTLQLTTSINLWSIKILAYFQIRRCSIGDAFMSPIFRRSINFAVLCSRQKENLFFKAVTRVKYCTLDALYSHLTSIKSTLIKLFQCCKIHRNKIATPASQQTAPLLFYGDIKCIAQHFKYFMPTTQKSRFYSPVHKKVPSEAYNV
jgi:hypothetical protein